MNINEITYKEIEALDEIDLTKLLDRLLRNESVAYNFTDIVEIVVPYKIKVGDAGDDGRVDCGGTNGSQYVTFPQSLFQCKATDLSEQEVYNEFFSVDIPAAPAVPKTKRKPAKPATVRKLELKEKIKQVLDKDGQYVFFIGRIYNSTLLDRRINGAKRALAEHNAVNGTAYKDTQIRVLDATEIANWTNKYQDCVTFVQSANGISRPLGLKTLSELSDYQTYQEIAFCTNDKLDSHINTIQQNIAAEKSSIRIIGHSGLGKTRLVYEALRSANQLQHAVYFDIVKDGDPIIQFVRTFGKKLNGILVIDNCDYYNHKLLKEEITRSGSTFKLISIDYNVAEEFDKSKTSQENYIFLNNRDYQDIVKKILNDQFEHRLEKSHIDQIADYSEGYPGMAVLFAQARINGTDDLSELLGDETIQRLAFGRDWENYDADRFEILRSCSIFSAFGRPQTQSFSLFTPEEKTLFREQMNLIVTEICDPPKSRKNFVEGTDYFENRRVMERRGNYLSVKPTPLAVKLAMHWWKYFDHSRLIGMFPELERLNLAVPLVNRLSELDQLREAREIVNDLWGPNSPFGSAEVLNTALGSRLFRSVAQVNPEAAMNAMEAAFAEMPLDHLKSEVGPGRRYLIWTLEILAFRKGLFNRAANLFFRFAAAENENISNNSTGQLLQLFQIILPGTEADLEQRFEVIKKQLESTSPEIRHLAIVAMLRGLKGESFRRDIGAEQQGTSAPLVDFHPTWAQSAQYWSLLINELLVQAENNPEERNMIKGGLSRSFRNLFYNNLSDLVEKIISTVLSFDKGLWDEAISQLHAVMEYEAVNDKEKDKVRKLLNDLQPQTFEDRIKYFVSSPSLNYQYKSEEEYIDHGAVNAERFAETLASEKVDLSEHLEVLLSGEQKKGFTFGRKLGELLQDPVLAKKMLDVLGKIDKSLQNPEVAAAYISALPQAERKTLLAKVLVDENLWHYAVYFTRIQNPDASQINDLFELIKDGKISPVEFYQFTYGRGLDGLTSDQVLDSLVKLSTFPDGGIVALELAEQYIGKDEERSALITPFLRKLIIDQNLLLQRQQGHAQYAWNMVTERLLDSGKDVELMRAILLQMLEIAKIDRISSIDTYLKRTVQKIIESDFKLFWELIGPAILDNSTYLSFKFFLDSNNGEYGSPGLISAADPEILVEWCKANSPLAPKRIAYMMPLTIRGDRTVWHPLATRMINEFGDIPGFMNELGANLHSFGSVGSQVPYLKEQQKLVIQLRNHPIENVRKWSAYEIAGLEKRIERTKLDDESEYLNF